MCVFIAGDGSADVTPHIHIYIYTLSTTQADGFHAFPSIDALAAAPEQALRDLGACVHGVGTEVCAWMCG